MRVFLLSIFAAAMAAGAARPVDFQAGTPVEIRPGIVLPSYWQMLPDTVKETGADTITAKRISAFGLREHLETMPAAETDLRASTRWLRAGQVSAIAGAVLLAVGTALDDPSGPEIAVPLFGGLGLMFAGAGFAVLSESRFEKAVRVYNASLAAPLGLDGGWIPGRGVLTLRIRF